MRFDVGIAEIVTCAIPAEPLQKRSRNPILVAVGRVYPRDATVTSNPGRTGRTPSLQAPFDRMKCPAEMALRNNRL